MRALFYEGAWQMPLREIDPPIAGPDDVIVAEQAAGVCGSGVQLIGMHTHGAYAEKTDQNDAMWLAQPLQHELLKPSFIPPAEQRDLRDRTRYRATLADDRTRVLNRIQKLLEGANLKLAAVASDEQGVTAQAILRALVGGETDPVLLAQLPCGKLQKKQGELERALTGQFHAHHRSMLTRLVSHLDFLDAELAALAARIDGVLEQLPTYAAAVERLDTIPGINRTAALVIVAEIGVAMECFPSDGHLAAWAGVAPRNNETGSKQRATARRKGNRHLQRTLVQAA